MFKVLSLVVNPVHVSVFSGLMYFSSCTSRLSNNIDRAHKQCSRHVEYIQIDIDHWLVIPGACKMLGKQNPILLL